MNKASKQHPKNLSQCRCLPTSRVWAGLINVASWTLAKTLSYDLVQRLNGI